MTEPSLGASERKLGGLSSEYLPLASDEMKLGRISSGPSSAARRGRQMLSRLSHTCKHLGLLSRNPGSRQNSRGGWPYSPTLPYRRDTALWPEVALRTESPLVG